MSQNTAYVHKGGDADVANLTTSNAQATAPAETTGLTVDYNGQLRRGVFKVTADYTAFQAAAVTKDLTLGTLPAKGKVVGCYCDTTVAFAHPTGQLTLTVGRSAGGAQYIASHDVDAAAVTKGLADADMGTTLTRAAAIQGGDLPSWSATSTLQCRMTSDSGNLSGLTAGSVTIYFILELF